MEERLLDAVGVCMTQQSWIFARNAACFCLFNHFSSHFIHRIISSSLLLSFSSYMWLVKCAILWWTNVL